MRGIPTIHKGRQYRSRLEARWASFFDRVGWQYEYEPFDLNGWIPDFALIGTGRTTLVEVKPYAVFPRHIADEIERSGAEEEVLILGMSIPVQSLETPSTVPLGCIGWLAERTPDYWCWSDALFGRWSSWGFTHAAGSWVDRISGTWCGGSWDRDEAIVEPLSRFWTDAGNIAQWMPPGGRR